MDPCVAEYLLVSSHLAQSRDMAIPSRHTSTDHLSSSQLMETFRNHQFRSYDGERCRKSAPRCRIMFTREQVAQLESLFAIDPYPKIRDRRGIAEVMGITERRVQVWFQNRRAKNSRSRARQDGCEIPASGIPFVPDIPVDLPTCTEKHYPNSKPKGCTDSDGEASSVSAESSRASPHAYGGFTVAGEAGFVPSVNVTTPYSNGVMYSAWVCRRRRATCSPDVERLDVPICDSTRTLSRMVEKLDATETEAVHQLRSFVDCQTKLLTDLRRSCESAFIDI